MSENSSIQDNIIADLVKAKIPEPKMISYGKLIIVDGVFIQEIIHYEGITPIGYSEDKYKIVDGKLIKL